MVRLSLLFVVLVGTAFGQLQYTVSGKGVPVLKVRGKEVLKTQMIFWGAKWRWAGVTVRKTEAPQTWSLASAALHLTGSLAWTVEPGKLIATYSFDVAEATPEAIGGGLEFRPAYEDGVFGGQGRPPELLDKQGWQWEMRPGQILRVTSETGFANVYFERGNRGVIRCMFYADEIPAGKRTLKLSFALPKEGTRVRSLDERYGEPDTSTWFRDALAPTASFVDLSHLNHKPAGKHGFVQAKGENLVLGNGTPIRFWGCNVQAYSLFVKDREAIKAHARRIAQLGFNLVRLHHHDSRRWVNPCLIQDGPTTQELNPEALDTYFYWVKCLRDEGIYVWVDLHVGRPFKPGDEIPDFAEVDKRKHETGAEFKGYCYVNKRVTELMQEFSRRLLTTTNPHTGLALKDDPAVMGLLVTNENDLTHHFGNGLLGDKGVPAHNRLFVAAAKAFAAKTGLDANALQKTWLPGPAKLLLNDMEYHWSQGMVEHLRQLGARVPIATGQMWGGNPHFSLPALTAGELVDVHTYERGEFLVRNPLYEGDFAQYIAASQVVGRPLTVTEWNTEDNARPRDPFTEPLYLGAIAAFQGWDAPMLYGYSQDALRGGKISAWSSHNHPGIIGLMPAAALLFRRGDVSRARETHVIQLTRETLFDQATGSRQQALLRVLPLQHRVAMALPAIKELPWLQASAIPDGARVVTDLAQAGLAADATSLTSDTGELKRDWQQGVFTINTPRSQGAVGWLGEAGAIELADCAIQVKNPKGAVILSSLDGKPLRESDRILVSAVARVVAQTEKRQRFALSEPVAGTVTLRSRHGAMRLIPLAGDGTPMAAATGRGPTFPLPIDRGTHWFLLVAAKR